jgi:hypothetical protein
MYANIIKTRKCKRLHRGFVYFLAKKVQHNQK